MSAIDDVVAAKLAAERGGGDAAELWRQLWAAYEKGGAEAVEALVGGLVDDPQAPRDGSDA
jgi:hypothetical protein